MLIQYWKPIHTYNIDSVFCARSYNYLRIHVVYSYEKIFQSVIVVKIWQLINGCVLKPKFTDCNLCKQSKKHGYSGNPVYNMYNKIHSVYFDDGAMFTFNFPLREKGHAGLTAYGQHVGYYLHTIKKKVNIYSI